MGSYFFSLVNKLRDSNKNKRFLEIVCFILFALYIFSIGSFSGRLNFNYICIGIFIVMSLFMLIYVILFGKIRIDLFAILLINFILSFFISNLVNLSFTSFPKSVLLQCLSALILYEFFVCIEKKHVIRIFEIITFAGFAFLLYYFIHYRSQILSLNFDSRLGSFFDNENEVAKEFGYFGILAFSCHLFSCKKNLLKNILFAIISMLFLIGILTTGSISNLLTFLLCILVASILKLKTKKGKIIFFASVVVLILLFILLLQLPMFSYFKTRIEKIFNTFLNGGNSGDASSGLRLYALIQYLQLFFMKPLFGFGFGQGKMYTAYNLVAHSTIGELLGCIGLYGFLAFELMFVFVFKKNYKKNNILFVIFLYIFIFQIFISSTYHSKIEYVLFAIAFSQFADSLDLKLISDKIKANLSKSLTNCFKSELYAEVRI